METEDLPVSHVYPHCEARPLDRQKVKALADSIREVGLMNPIIVRPAMKVRNGAKSEAWEIIAGHHRYEACAVHLKWENVPCVVKDTTDLLAELMMIDENLCRSDLTPAQEAYQTARRKEIYEALHPEAKNGSNQHNRVGKICQPSFADDQAGKTGEAPRTIRLNAARGEALGETLKAVTGTSLDKGVELDALAKLDPQQREEIVSRAQRGEKVSARQVKMADEPLNDFEAKEKQVAALMSAWNKAGQEARKEFMDRVNYGDEPVMGRKWS